MPFAAALKKVPGSIIWRSMTTRPRTLPVAPFAAHALEAWGDARTYDGTATIVQPLIEPLFDGKSVIEVIAMISGDKMDITGGGREIVRRTMAWLTVKGEALSDWQWKQALERGDSGRNRLEDGRGGRGRPATSRSAGCHCWLAQQCVENARPEHCWTSQQWHPARSRRGFEVVSFPDAKLYDGRFANNGWLQELPDPMTRLTWDNAALVSPHTAETLGASRDDLVTLKSGERQLTVPLFILPGMADGMIGLALGYGRTAAGRLGNGVGQNAYLLRTSKNLGWQSGVTVELTGKTYPLATVQDHHIIDKVGKEAVQERIPELIKEGTFAAYQHDPAVGVEKAEAVSIFDEHKLDGRVDGPADDAKGGSPFSSNENWDSPRICTSGAWPSTSLLHRLRRLRGRLPGREQHPHRRQGPGLRGREMHWIRIDRYFFGDAENGRGSSHPAGRLRCSARMPPARTSARSTPRRTAPRG